MARISQAEEGGAAGGVRLFLALDLPDGARATIARCRDSAVGAHGQLRPVASEALHVTLVFLGQRPREQVSEIWQAVASAAIGLHVPTLTPARFVSLPPRRPRLLAVELDDEDGIAGVAHGAFGGALAAAGLHEPEARAFWPHVTLARVRGRSRLPPVDVPPPPRQAFAAAVVTLLRSDLHPSGARYVPLRRLELGRP